MFGQNHLHRDILAGLIVDGTHGLLMVKVAKESERGKKEERPRDGGSEGGRRGGKESKRKKSKVKKRKKEKRKIVPSCQPGPSSQSGRAAMGSSGRVEIKILICMSSPMQQVVIAKEVGYLRTCALVLWPFYQNI